MPESVVKFLASLDKRTKSASSPHMGLRTTSPGWRKDLKPVRSKAGDTRRALRVDGCKWNSLDRGGSHLDQGIPVRGKTGGGESASRYWPSWTTGYTLAGATRGGRWY